MAQPIQQFTLRGQGFQGLNTEMSPIGSDPSFALKADNVIVDRVGRIAAREAFSKYVPDVLALGSYLGHEVTALSAHYEKNSDGTFVPHAVCTVASGDYVESKAPGGYAWDGEARQTPSNNQELDPDKGVEYSLAYEKSGTLRPCAIPAGVNPEGLSRSLYVHFKDDLLLFSKDNPPLKYNGNGGFTKLSDMPDYEPPVGPDGDPITMSEEVNGDVAISAYGRLWVSGVDGDYQTIYYSSLLREDLWYDGQPVTEDSQNTAGIINVSEYWPVDFDEIVNIHAHNGYLIVFGRRSIIVYANADSGDPAGENGIVLQDGISNVGLVERDAICNIGTDVLFCDDTGVRSFGRAIQEKSNPVGEASMNIKREITDMIAKEAVSGMAIKGIKMCYVPSASLFLCLFKSDQVAYAFSTERPSSSGGLKVTRWTDCYFNDAYFAEDGQVGFAMLGGKFNRGVLRYGEYDGYETFRMDFESMALGIGERVQNVVSKSIIYLLLAQAVPAKAKAKWGFGSYLNYHQDFMIETKGSTEYAVAEFGVSEYVGGRPGIWKTKINTIGAGEFLRVGLEIEIDRQQFALQEIAVNTAIGRIAA